MNGILILAEDIISVAGGGLAMAWANTGHNAGQLSKLVAVCWSTEWWDYSYLITDIHQVTTLEQLPPSQLSQNYLYPLLLVCVCVTALLLSAVI